MTKSRLDRFLSNSKIGSRSEVKILIKFKRVRVNGIIIVDPSFKVKPNDIVEVDGIEVTGHKDVYIKLYKPRDFVSSTKDERNKTVLDLIDHQYKDELSIAGRLDKNVEGLILLTSNGELLHRIISTKFLLEKIYEILVEGTVDLCKIEELKEGFQLGDGYTIKPIKVYEIKEKSSRLYEMKLGLIKGESHIIKRTFKSLNCKVRNIKRVSIGPIKLDDDMESGDWKELTFNEIKKLFDVVNLKPEGEILGNYENRFV